MSELGDLPPDQARLWMHRVAGWVADYRERIDKQRITPDLAPGDIAAALPAAPPEHGDKLAAIFEEFERVIMPGMVHGSHPAAPGILGEWLATVLNVGAPSPVATELETTVLGWIRSMLGLAESFEGVAYDTASLATLHALGAAREATGLEVRRRGLAGAPKLLIYTSEQAHGSVEKAAVMLGLGEDNVRRVETDGEFRLRPAALRAAVARVVHARLRPFAVVATVGTPRSAAVDPVPAIADVCAEQRLWLHVDAASGGAMAVLPEGRWVMDGVNRADSVVVTPHEWLFVPLDFSALYTRRPEMLRAVDDDMKRGRRFRALKAWMAFRAFGRAGFESRIREHVRLARRFADWVEADPDFELAAPVTMGVVCFRAHPADMVDAEVDALNTRLAAQVTSTGRVSLAHTRLEGRVTMRVAMGNVLTTERHLVEAWTLVHDAFDRLLLG